MAGAIDAFGKAEANIKTEQFRLAIHDSRFSIPLGPTRERALSGLTGATRSDSNRHTPRAVKIQNPRSSLMNKILTRCLGNAFSVMVHVLQIRSGLLQFWQNEVA